MKNLFRISILIFFITGLTHSNYAQDVQSTDEIQKLKQEIELLRTVSDSYKPGKSQFMLRGYAHSGLQANSDQFSFVGGSFNPLLVYKQSDRLLFESELEMELVGSEVELGVEYANISYLLSKNVTLRAGKILVPFGIFVPNLHPAWINKLPTAPLGAGHEGILPTNDIGVEVRGGSYIGNIKMNYSLFAVNGGQLNDGAEEPEEGGIIHHGIFPDNNNGKTIGGRMGLFPLSNSSMELGFSAMYGNVGAEESTVEDVKALHYAFDISYVKMLPSMSSVLDLKAQYTAVNVDDANYPEHDDPNELVTFDNKSKTWFAQVSLRPALVENPIVRNLEIVGRYSTLNTPEGAEWEVNQTQTDIGINYWVDWRTVVKLSYRIRSGFEEGHDDEPSHGGIEEDGGNAFYIHWAIGF